jgi:transposase
METNNQQEFEKQFFEMRTSGYKVRDIAKKLKKSTNTICNLNKKYFKEITDIKNAELAELQKKIIEQKKERLDFLKEQLLILNDKIFRSEIIMKYQDMVKLSLKMSDSINKCEHEMLIIEITGNNILGTNVIGENTQELIVNAEDSKMKKTSDNKITNSDEFIPSPSTRAK